MWDQVSYTPTLHQTHLGPQCCQELRVTEGLGCMTCWILFSKLISSIPCVVAFRALLNLPLYPSECFNDVHMSFSFALLGSELKTQGLWQESLTPGSLLPRLLVLSLLPFRHQSHWASPGYAGKSGTVNFQHYLQFSISQHSEILLEVWLWLDRLMLE